MVILASIDYVVESATSPRADAASGDRDGKMGFAGSGLRNLVPDQRAKITALLQALLIEAAAEIQDTAGEEVRNDEDRS